MMTMTVFYIALQGPPYECIQVVRLGILFGLHLFQMTDEIAGRKEGLASFDCLVQGGRPC